MPERIDIAVTSIWNGLINTVPFSILLVIFLLLGNKIKFVWYEIILYFVGSVITGYYFSSFTIELINKYLTILSPEGETVVTAAVAIFGFLALVYIVKNDLVNKLIGAKFTRYTKKQKEDSNVWNE